MPSSKTEIPLVVQRKTNEAPGWERQRGRQTAETSLEQLIALFNQLERNRSHARAMADEEKLEEPITTLRDVALVAFSGEQGRLTVSMPGPLRAFCQRSCSAPPATQPGTRHSAGSSCAVLYLRHNLR